MEGGQDIDKYFVLFAGSTAMLVLCAGIVLLFRAYNKKLLLQQEEKNRLELAYRDELLYSNIQAAEDERARIARDLHDGVGASLSLLRMQLNNSSAENRANAKSVVDSTIDNVRRIAYNLLPPALEAFGLVAAVEVFCEKIRTDAGIDVQLEVFDESLHFTPSVELTLYRVLQELVNNSLKYAAATAFEISFQYAGNELTMNYADNGKGYDPVKEMKEGGLGLKNITLRIKQQNGNLQYNQMQGGCIGVSIRIPVKPILL